jgi:Family of unknown function (DUF5343)
MAVPKAYLTSTKKVGDVLTAIQSAQAPKQFTVRFLENLGFKTTSDRLMIGMLKALGFLNASGTPTPRYFEFLDQTQGGRVLAEAVREAYADLFELNVNANKMTRDEVKNKLKTLTQGQFTDDVLGRMANTFTAFANQADFEAVEPAEQPDEETPAEEEQLAATGDSQKKPPRTFELGGLVYNIQIQLPESRDAAVYDALFRSLKTHLFGD